MPQRRDPDQISAPRPDAAKAVGAVVRSLYDLISGPVDAARNWDRFRSFFLPGARLIPQHRVPAGPVQIMDVEAYIARVEKLIAGTGFHEREVAARIDIFGAIAHVLSTYEARHALDEKEPFMRGINSIQLLYEGGRWQVASVIWDIEGENNPIPVQYLPSN